MNKKISYIFIIISLLSIASFVYSTPITVPSAPSAGYMLTSTSTGQYLATTTDPLHVGNIYSTSTATSTFNGGVRVNTGGFTVTGLSSCNLDTDSSGNLICGTDANSGGTNDWVNLTTYSANALTPSTTVPVWLRGAAYASSTLTLSGVLTSNSTATSTFAGSLLLGTGTTTSALTFADGKRVDFYSDDLWAYSTQHQADRIRFYNTTDTAKSAITWYDATSTTPVAVAAIITHDLLSAGNEHKHISIETVADDYQALDSRFECTYGQVAGADGAYCGSASSHSLRVGSGGDLQVVDGNIRMTGANSLFDFFPANQTTIGWRVATTTSGTDTVTFTATGADFMRFDDDIYMQGTTPLFFMNATNASSTSRWTGESALDYRGLYMEYGGVPNVGIIGTHDAANLLDSSDIPQIVLTRAGGITFSKATTFSNLTTDITTGTNEHFVISPNGTGKVGIGTTTPGKPLTVEGTAWIAQLETGWIMSTSTAQNSYFLGKLGISTSTTQWPLSIFGTASQLALSNGAGFPLWTLANLGGNLYFSTTTLAGTATSTNAAVTFHRDGGCTGCVNMVVGGINLRDAKFVSATSSSFTADTRKIVYTAPTGKRAMINGGTFKNVFSASAVNRAVYLLSGSNFLQITATSSVAADTISAIQGTPGIILDPGESLIVIINATSDSFYVEIPIIEYNSDIPIYTSKVSEISSGTTTVYTVPTGKNAFLLGDTINTADNNLIFFNGSSAARSIKWHVPRNGDTAEQGNLVSPLTSVGSNTISVVAVATTMKSSDSIVIAVPNFTMHQHAWVNIVELDN